MRQRSDWFTIVATDLFAGAFAAILIIDAATPKHPVALGQATLFSMRYAAPTSSQGIDCNDPNNVVFLFTDEQGDSYNTLDVDLSSQRAGEYCEVIGIIDDVALTSSPSNGRVGIIRRPADVVLGDVSIKLSSFELTCTESEFCTN